MNGQGEINELAKRNLLGPDLLIIHGNWISNAELKLMAETRTPICFTPSADVQATPADVVGRAMRRGVDVVFGADIPCHVAADPVHQLRIMFYLQAYLDGQTERTFGVVLGRRPPVGPDMPLLRPRTLFRLATREAARVLGLDDKVGSLTPGKRADVVLFDAGPFGDSVTFDPCAQILLQGSPRDVDTVIVDGDVRMSGGALVGFDKTRARRMIAESRQRILGA
jgi:5-methylthioadenosine/S-adenosylhomocysteine deaminase